MYVLINGIRAHTFNYNNQLESKYIFYPINIYYVCFYAGYLIFCFLGVHFVFFSICAYINITQVFLTVNTAFRHFSLES